MKKIDIFYNKVAKAEKMKKTLKPSRNRNWNGNQV